MRPSAILFGRNGSAIEGRAQPMKSSTPWRTMRTIVSGEVKRPTPTTGFDDNARNAAHQALLRRLLLEARGTRAILPGAVGEVPEIGQVGVHGHEIAHLGIGEAEIADRLVEGDAQRDRHGVADHVAHVGDHLADEAGAVLERAAIFVGALVGRPRQEMLEDTEAVGAVETDQVEAGGPAAPRRVGEPAAQVGDVLLVHRPRGDGIVGEGADRQRGGRERHLLRVHVRPVDAGISELDAGERAVGLHRLGHAGDRGDILILPQPELDERRDFRGMVHLGLLGEDHPPAALGLDAAHRRRRRRIAIAAAVAMGHLVEPVLGRQRADADGLEQDVVGGGRSQHGSPRRERDAFAGGPQASRSAAAQRRGDHAA